METPTKPADVAKAILRTDRANGKVLIIGNGGSAAMAQHLAAELMVRYKKDRPPIPAIALTADSAVVTAIANDYGYEFVFARQIMALGKPEDVLVIFSTSGKGEPLMRARNMASHMRMLVIEAPRAQPASRVSTAGNQEYQLGWLHNVCEEIDNAF